MAQRDEHGNAHIVYAHLSGLLSAGQVLVLYRSPGLLLCLMCEQGEPRLLSVQATDAGGEAGACATPPSVSGLCIQCTRAGKHRGTCC
jgi:hypothetical protein